MGFKLKEDVRAFESKFKILPDSQTSEEKYPRDHFPASTKQQSASQTVGEGKVPFAGVWRLAQFSRPKLIFH